MTEFVIGTMLFLMPVFLIIPMMGKYSDVKAAAAQTARYAAWERTVWYGGSSASVTWPGNSKGEQAIKREAGQRVIAYGGVLKDSDKSATAFAESGGRYLWRNRDSSAMLEKYDDSLLGSITNSGSPDTVTNDILGAITSVTAITGFNLETNGYYAGSASIPVVTMPIGLNLDGSTAGRFEPGTLTFTDKNVILANGWGANGRAHVKTQTAGIAPLGLVNDSTFGDVFKVATCVALAAFAPEFCWLEVGKIEPDVVPPDRLSNQ